MLIDPDYGGQDPHATVVDHLDVYAELSRIIDRAIELQDLLDGDPDLEPAGDELDAAGFEWIPGQRSGRPIIGNAMSHEDAEDSFDAEPSLGWREQRAGAGDCSTCLDEAEPDHDRERCALELHGMGFFATGHDDAEEDDHAGGDICDEPHDAANTFDDSIADRDAADLLLDECRLWDILGRTTRERRRVHDETRAALASVTGIMPPSHWDRFHMEARPCAR